MPKKDEDQEELVNRSWEIVSEALRTGSITLAPLEVNGKEIENVRSLETEAIIDLAKFFVQLKVKKPQVVTTPEDFKLPETSIDDED